MPPRKKTPRAQNVVLDVEDTPGSGQSRESYQRDLAAQPALLAAAAASMTSPATTSTSASSPPSTSTPAAKKSKKKKLSDLDGFADLASVDNGAEKSGTKKARTEKAVEAKCILATKQNGEDKGQLSGNVLYGINCAYDDNEALKARVAAFMGANTKPRYIPAFGKFTVHVPTAEIARDLHAAILADPKMAATRSKLNKVLDTTAFEHEVVKAKKPSFMLAESETQFETRADGVLPRSILIVGKNTYAFKEFFKAKFPEIRYLDLLFNAGTVTKSGWVLPTSAQTEATGTLADYLRKLGVDVTEEDLDDGEDDDEDDDERDGDALVDVEAAEAEEDEEDEGADEGAAAE